MPPRRSPPLLAHLVALLVVGGAAAWAPPLGSQAAAPALAPRAPDAEVARYLRSEMAARSIPGLAWAAVEDGARNTTCNVININNAAKMPWPIAGPAVAEAPANGFWNCASMIRSTISANPPSSSR